MPVPMNRIVAGYHMLLILAAVDNHYSDDEEKIISGYALENHHESIDFSTEEAFIKNLTTEDYAVRFNDAMNSFYMQSDKAQRNQFLNLATRLIIADKGISPRENLFLNELYYAWEEETEE